MQKLSACELYPELISELNIVFNQEALDVYLEIRAAGETHRWAAMCALQQAPKAMTDREFFEDRGTLAQQYNGAEFMIDGLVRHAKSHGYTPQYTDVYVPGLARFRGDPEAFVPASGGRSHIKAVCEKRGWSCDGSVKVQGTQQPPPKQKRLGEDIVRQSMVEESLKPENRGISRKDLREKVIEKHGAS